MLLAIYFFLAGCVVSQSRMLWVMPAASAVFACVLALTAVASSALSSSYRWACWLYQYKLVCSLERVSDVLDIYTALLPGQRCHGAQQVVHPVNKVC